MTGKHRRLAAIAAAAVGAISTVGTLVGVGAIGAAEAGAAGTRPAAVPTASPAQWHVMRPAAAPGGTLRAVSCVHGSSFCIAVGSEVKAGVAFPMAELFNGKAWKTTPTPPGAAAHGFSLESVSCVSSSSCTAVGSRETATKTGEDFAIDVWNGRRWNEAATLSSLDHPAFLSSVSCASTKVCAAVGEENVGSKSRAFALTEKGGAHRWKIAAVPATAGSAAALSGVSCSTISSCVAVGSVTVDGQSGALALVWNGTSWSRRALTSRTSSASESASEIPLTSVSCVSAKRCTAVGIPSGTKLPGASVEIDGSTTRLTELSPDRGYQVAPASIYCDGSGSSSASSSSASSSSENCYAVGVLHLSHGGPEQAAEHSVGSKWASVPTATLRGTWADLESVSCSDATRCLAVGIQQPVPANGNEGLLIEKS